MASYFLDFISGNDGNAGTSSGVPKKTLENVSDLLGNGDTVSLKAAQSHRGKLTVNALTGLTLNKYDAGADPIIKGSDLVTGWSPSGAVPLDSEDFEDSAVNATYWANQQQGVVDAVVFQSGTKSWKFAPPTTGGLVVQRNAGTNSNYVEWTCYIRVSSTSTATTGQKARLIGMESSVWNGANGVYLWVNLSGSQYRIGLGRGTAAASNYNISTNTWYKVRVVLLCNGGSSADSCELYVDDVSRHTISGMSLTASQDATLCYGLSAYNPNQFVVNFDNVSVYNSAGAAGLYYASFTKGTNAPQFVVIDGTYGTAKASAAACTTNNDWYFDDAASRVYLKASADPDTFTTPGVEIGKREQAVEITDWRNLTIDALVSFAQLNFRVTKPLATTSPWRTVIPGGVGYINCGFAGRITYASLGNWPDALIPKWVQARESDPLRTLYFNALSWQKVADALWARSGNNSTIEAEIVAGMSQTLTSAGYDQNYQFNYYSSCHPTQFIAPADYRQRTAWPWSFTFRVPDSFLPNNDPDGHTYIVQPNGWVLEMLAPIKLGTGAQAGNWVCGFGSYTDFQGSGTGFHNGRRASLVPSYAGILFDDELADGATGNFDAIQHAIALGITAAQLSSITPVGVAEAFDRDTSNYQGTNAMGARLAIPSSVNLAARTWQSNVGRAIAKAMQVYGGFLTDRSGPSDLLFLTEDPLSAQFNWSGLIEADLFWIRDQLHRVLQGQWIITS